MSASEQTGLINAAIIVTFFLPYQGSSMNSKYLTVGLFIGALLTPVAVYATDSDADRAHPVAFVKDSVITTKIKTKLAAEKLRSMTHIRVDTDSNGMVVLGGSAKNQGFIDKAGAIALATEGVTSVQNNIKVKKDD